MVTGSSDFAAEFVDVHVSFGAQDVLVGVSTGVARGSTTFVVGRSGCGKSVLTRLLVGMLIPDRGDVIVNGRTIASMTDSEVRMMRRSFALVPQAPALFDSMDVISNVAFPLVANGIESVSDARTTAAGLLDRFGLGGRATAMPGDLNVSDAKIVSVLRSMAMDPECLILDEPTTGLDAIARDAVDNMISELGDDGRTTIVVVSHDMQATLAIADRIVFLYNGAIRLEGTPDDFRAASMPGAGVVDPVVAQFLSGSPDGPMTVGAF